MEQREMVKTEENLIAPSEQLKIVKKKLWEIIRKSPEYSRRKNFDERVYLINFLDFTNLVSDLLKKELSYFYLNKNDYNLQGSKNTYIYNHSSSMFNYKNKK